MRESEGIVRDFKYNSRLIIKISILIVFVILTILLYTKIINPTNDEVTNDIPESISIKFSDHNLPAISFGHYALWYFDASNNPILFKRFNVIDNGLISLNGESLDQWEVESNDTPTKFLITIEREGDRNNTPEQVSFLSGALENNKSSLKLDLTSDVNSASGQLILASPTDGNDGINEKSGVWFSDSAFTSSSLKLQTLTNTSWTWQANLVSESNQLLIGNFQDPNTSDDSKRFSLPSENPPKFPGEDFFQNLPNGLSSPINLANGKYTVLISLEPVINNEDYTGEKPFITVLEANITNNATNPITMANVFSEPYLNIEYLQ